MTRFIDALKPEAAAAARRMFATLEGGGVRYYVSETYRDHATQVAYYAQGRQPLADVNRLRAEAELSPITEEANRSTITKCDGIRYPSPHQSGRALDVYPMQGGKIVWSVTHGTLDLWRAIGEAGELAGFEWGGRWTPLDKNGIGWDAPHFELPA